MIYRKLLFFITWLLCLTTLPKVFIKFESSFSCLIDALKTLNTKLNKSNESSHSYSAPYFKGNLSIFPFNNTDYRCVTYSLYYADSVPFIHRFFQDFTTKGCWTLSKSFSHLLKWSCDFCPKHNFLNVFLLFLIVCMYLWGMCTSVQVPTEVSDSPLKLALQAAVNCLTWVLRIKLRSFERALPALNQWAVSPVHAIFLVLLMVGLWRLL